MTAARSAPVARLLERLRRPVAALSPEDLAAVWRRYRIEVVCGRPPDFDAGPGLAQRVRGAWGEQLGRTLVACAPGGDTTPFTLLELLFGSAGRLRRGDERPKSYVIATELQGDALVVVVTLFGFTGYWTAQAADALCRALQDGIKVAQPAQARARPAIRSARIERFDAVTPPALGSSCFVFLDTPLDMPGLRDPALVDLAPREAEARRAQVFFCGLANRVGGVARWQDYGLAIDWPRYLAVAGRVRLDGSALWQERWQRWSRNQPGRPIEMAGERPRLYLEGDLQPFAALLALGETCHVGEDATLGLGRYTLAPV